MGETGDQTLIGSRAKAIFALGLAFGFVALGVWLIKLGPLKAVVVGWLSIVFFGGGSPLIALQIFRPVRVHLTRTEFSIISPTGATKTVAWRDVEPFFIWKYKSTSLVAFSYLPDRRPTNAMTRILETVGCDGSFPSGLKISTKELLALANGYRLRAINDH